MQGRGECRVGCSQGEQGHSGIYQQENEGSQAGLCLSRLHPVPTPPATRHSCPGPTFHFYPRGVRGQQAHDPFLLDVACIWRSHKVIWEINLALPWLSSTSDQVPGEAAVLPEPRDTLHGTGGIAEPPTDGLRRGARSRSPFPYLQRELEGGPPEPVLRLHAVLARQGHGGRVEAPVLLPLQLQDEHLGRESHRPEVRASSQGASEGSGESPVSDKK